MSAPPTRVDRLRLIAGSALGVAVVACGAAAGYGIYEWVVDGNRATGLGFLGVGLAGLLIGILLYCQVLLVHKFVNYAYRAYDALLEASDLMRRQAEHVRTIAENSSLSEWAKRIVYREKDFEFLRDTIQGAIVRQDWEAAEHLIHDVEAEFGYREEAAALRGTLDQARKATTEERIAAARSRVDSLCDQRKWQQARAECERLAALFPGYPAIVELPHQIESRRQEFKHQLIKEYDLAVRNQDVDRAHRLLFALDQELVPEEAEPLKESARNVFRARLEQLKTRFTIAVSYQQFRDAIEAGERLIHEFPNSGYAREISKILPVLRKRVSQPTSHAASGHSAP